MLTFILRLLSASFFIHRVLSTSVAYPGIFSGGGGLRQEFFRGGGGFNKFSWGPRVERTGIWGRWPPSQRFHSICKWVKPVFWLGCYGCIFHGTGNLAQFCQNLGISVRHCLCPSASSNSQPQRTHHHKSCYRYNNNDIPLIMQWKQCTLGHQIHHHINFYIFQDGRDIPVLVTVRPSLNFILGVKICTLDREDRVSGETSVTREDRVSGETSVTILHSS
jgi:hypothetical protein